MKDKASISGTRNSRRWARKKPGARRTPGLDPDNGGRRMTPVENQKQNSSTQGTEQSQAPHMQPGKGVGYPSFEGGSESCYSSPCYNCFQENPDLQKQMDGHSLTSRTRAKSPAGSETGYPQRCCRGHMLKYPCKTGLGPAEVRGKHQYTHDTTRK